MCLSIQVTTEAFLGLHIIKCRITIGLIVIGVDLIVVTLLIGSVVHASMVSVKFDVVYSLTRDELVVRLLALILFLLVLHLIFILILLVLHLSFDLLLLVVSESTQFLREVLLRVSVTQIVELLLHSIVMVLLIILIHLLISVAGSHRSYLLLLSWFFGLILDVKALFVVLFILVTHAAGIVLSDCLVPVVVADGSSVEVGTGVGVGDLRYVGGLGHTPICREGVTLQLVDRIRLHSFDILINAVIL